MSQRNFVEQFNLFFEYARRNKLTSYERMFYLALFSCANECARQGENYEWPDDYFPASNAELIGWTGFDERAIRNTRNSLKQKGLIDFIKGDGKKRDPAYCIFYMKRTGYKIVPDVQLEEQRTGSKNAGGTKSTGGKNAPDSKAPHVTDCKSAPDTVPDGVGDTVPDGVSDHVSIGCEFAGEHFIINKPNVGTNVNAKANYPVVVPEEDARETSPEAAEAPKRADTLNTGAGVPDEPEGPEEAQESENPLYDKEFGKVMSFYMDHLNPTPSALSIAGLKEYTADLGSEVVVHAMQIALDERKVSWSYLRGILNRYRREGLTCIIAVQQSEMQHSSRKSDRPTPAKVPYQQGAQRDRTGSGLGLVNMGAGAPRAGGLVPGLGKKGW